MEDATSAIYSAFLADQEGTASSVRDVVAKHGLFCSLYTDRGCHYFFTPEGGGPVSKTVLTQFGRALKQLGIEHIAAYSPQARRRSERAFETLQHRLPKELKLAGIDTVEAANRWLSDTYIAEYNERFAIAAEQEGSAFMTDAMEAWREILCIQEDRTVGNDNTVRNLQLPPSRLRPHFVKATVRVHEYPDGQLAVYWGPHRLADYAPGRHLDAAAAKHRCGDRGQPCGLSLRHGIRTGGGWPLGRPAIAFRYVTLCRTWSAKPRRLIGPPVAPATRGMSSRAVGGSVANIVEPACGYVDNALRVVHIPIGPASAEACRFFACSGQ